MNPRESWLLFALGSAFFAALTAPDDATRYVIRRDLFEP